MTAYVGIDLHRRRSLVVCIDGEGERLWWRRIDNSPVALGEVIAEAGPGPEVVIEATWGWYWAADVVTEAGGRVHLAHPLGIKGFQNRRVKNDLVDATMLADRRCAVARGLVVCLPIGQVVAAGKIAPAIRSSCQAGHSINPRRTTRTPAGTLALSPDTR